MEITCIPSEQLCMVISSMLSVSVFWLLHLGDPFPISLLWVSRYHSIVDRSMGSKANLMSVVCLDPNCPPYMHVWTLLFTDTHAYQLLVERTFERFCRTFKRSQATQLLLLVTLSASWPVIAWTISTQCSLHEAVHHVLLIMVDQKPVRLRKPSSLQLFLSTFIVTMTMYPWLRQSHHMMLLRLWNPHLALVSPSLKGEW